GHTCAAPRQPVSQQPIGAGSSRRQRPQRPDARVQVPPIGWRLLSCLRRVTQLSPFPLPNQSASLRRLPQVPLPSPHRNGSEGVASCLKNLDLHPASSKKRDLWLPTGSPTNSITAT